MNLKTRALVVHKSEVALAELRATVEKQVPCDIARTTDEALARLATTPYAIIVVEHQPPAQDVLASLPPLLSAAPESLIILITADADAARQLDDRAPGRLFRFLARQDQRWQLSGTVAEAMRLVRLEQQQRELVTRLGIEKSKLVKRERLLDVVVKERTRELEVAYQRLKASTRQALLSLAEAIEAKDPYTKGHCGRVAAYSMALAQACDLPHDQWETLEFGSFLHDIGKIGVRDAVLLKPGPLDDEEWKHMRAHPAIGDQIASQIELLTPARPAIRSHHERWDGKGYPDGLKGEDIPLIARIVCITDAFDAMITDRPYKRALPLDVSYGFLRKGAGAQFDPALIDAFINKQVGEQFVQTGAEE